MKQSGKQVKIFEPLNFNTNLMAKVVKLKKINEMESIFVRVMAAFCEFEI